MPTRGQQASARRRTQPAVGRAGALVITLLAVSVAVAIPSQARGDVRTKTIKPVQKTRHALYFAPRSVPADTIVRAQVLVRDRKTGGRKTRPIPVAKVRRAIERKSRVRVHKGQQADGRLTIRFASGATQAPPPPGPPSTIPSAWSRFASFESNLTGDTDGWRADAPFNLIQTSEVGGSEGDYAAKIVTNGGDGGCSCPRMTFQEGFSYGPGSDVWISGSWLIPDPSKVAWSRLMNLGHYGGTDRDWYLGLESVEPGRFQVGYAPYADPHVAVLPSRPIPANRWFRVDIHFVLSPTDGKALTEWFIDGQLVGSTTNANMLNDTPLHFYNAGLSYFWPGNGETTVYFDAPRHTS